MSPLCRNCDSFASRPGLGARLSILVEVAGTATKVASVDDALTLIRANGGRVTTPRRLLLEVLFETDQHLSAEELANAVHTRAPEVHLSTIYRNVEDLQRLGVIAHSHIGHGAITYQLAALSHAHFLCEGVGPRSRRQMKCFEGWPVPPDPGWVSQSTRTTSRSRVAVPLAVRCRHLRGPSTRRSSGAAVTIFLCRPRVVCLAHSGGARFVSTERNDPGRHPSRSDRAEGGVTRPGGWTGVRSWGGDGVHRPARG